MPINRNTTIEELLEAGAIELRELSHRGPIILKLKPLEAWALIGNLQLALASERNRGATARIGRRIGRVLEHEVATTPALKEIVRHGWSEDTDWPH
ncbi:MAG: hypothetical protein ACREQ4_14855 [Candidatus Binataceae bacterium]